MSPDIQAKFLRVLEGSTFERVGGGKQVNVDVRVVAATNRDLEVAVRENQFRQDLFFRLQVIEMTVPPLREHPDDIPQIVQHFVERFSRKSRVRVKGFNREAMAILLLHPWPGNVRELRNVVERAVILSDREILTPEDIVLSQVNPVSSSPSAPLVKETPPPVSRDPMAERPTEPGHRRPQAPSAPVAQASVLPAPDPFAVLAAEGATLDDVDQRYLEAVLEHCGWNKSNAARVLGIERTTLDRRLKRYGLERPPRESG
jgi:Nif-specific regulatory protein